MSKTQVNEIDRNIYDIKNKDDYEFKMQKGLSREIVEQISKRKNEPDWMLEIRLKALEMYEKLELPTWGPDLSELKMDEIATYVKPKTNLNSSWEDVPEEIKDTLERLGYKVEYKSNIFNVVVPTWRSTGDVSMKDDVLGDIARLIGYEYFEAKPLPVNFTSSVNQPKVTLERRLREYLAYRCGFNEIFTYPWIDEKYIKAAKIDTNRCERLATPPSPELSILRCSLVPGLLEVVSKNLRYFETFKIFEMTEVYEKGEYHESTEEEVLPIHKKMLSGAIVGKDPKDIFFELKGVLEEMSSYNHMEEITFKQEEKPTWADREVYLNIYHGKEEVGTISLVAVPTMNESGIKRTNIAIFEIEFDKLVPFKSRTNKYTRLPLFPLVEKDLSLLVDTDITWEQIKEIIKPMVKEVIFIEEYNGDKIPEGKKSITLRVKIGNNDSTMTTEQITSKVGGILKVLGKKLNIILREE